MAHLKGTKSYENLKLAFSGEAKRIDGIYILPAMPTLKGIRILGDYFAIRQKPRRDTHSGIWIF